MSPEPLILPGTIGVVPPDATVMLVPVQGPQGEPGSVVGGISPEAAQELIDTNIDVHVNDTTPHPAYDDTPSLVLLFNNGLV